MNKFMLFEKDLFSNPFSTSYSQFLQANKNSYSSKSHSFKKKEEPLVDIELFRRSTVIHDPHQYSAIKRQNGMYQAVFFGFGLFFLILSTIIYFKTVNFTCGLYFGECSLIKEYINLSCLFLAGGAFLVGRLINPDQEAFRRLFGKVEMNLEGRAKKIIHQINKIFDSIPKMGTFI